MALMQEAEQSVMSASHPITSVKVEHTHTRGTSRKLHNQYKRTFRRSESRCKSSHNTFRREQ